MNTDNIETPDNFSTCAIEQSIETSFFYTQDKFINQIDNQDFFNFIMKKYPDFNVENDDATIKKQLILILDDEKFMRLFLSHFKISIFDFFCVLNRYFSSIFKGPYIKKLKMTLGKFDYV